MPTPAAQYGAQRDRLGRSADGQPGSAVADRITVLGSSLALIDSTVVCVVWFALAPLACGLAQRSSNSVGARTQLPGLRSPHDGVVQRGRDVG